MNEIEFRGSILACQYETWNNTTIVNEQVCTKWSDEAQENTLPPKKNKITIIKKTYAKQYLNIQNTD